MFEFSFTPDWRSEKDQFYVLSTGGTDDAEAVQLNIDYRSASNALNDAQIAYNYRISEQSTLDIVAAHAAYITARRALIDYIIAKDPTFVDPDQE